MTTKTLEPLEQLRASTDRRTFLRGGAAAAAAIAMPFELLGAGVAHAVELPYSPDYGPLRPTIDQATGLPLLQLPPGFRYTSYGWTGDMTRDNVATPSLHDGMAVCGHDGDRIVLVRNHEQGGTTGSFAPNGITYDPMADGGTTNLSFNPRTGRFVSSWVTLSGTIRNCAGGPTPWNSWLTCEETTNGPHTAAGMKQHGWVFDVPAVGAARPVPLLGLGAFSHEACAVDPVTGIVYETEDSTPSGFYRFIPKVRGHLALGGRLQMMKLVAPTNASIVINGIGYGYFNTGAGFANGTSWAVEWVDIPDPTKAFVSGTSYGGVRAQGLQQGASSIVRGEGAWYGNGVIYVCSTSGGAAGNGQIFAYDPRRETFTLVYESPSQGVLDNPDNIAWSPRGSLILCEDGDATPQMLRGLTADGTIFPFCANNVVLNNYTRPSGKVFNDDFRGSEFAGSCFHDEWLFVNIQTPGITFAITGPWDNGAL